MLHVLVVILKLIGIIILTILLLALFLLIIVLFVPVRYRAYAIKKDELYAKASASWMLHLLHFNLYFDENGLQTSFRIVGISSQKWQELFRKIKHIFVKEKSKKRVISRKEKRSNQKKKRNQEVILKNSTKEPDKKDFKITTEQPELQNEIKVEKQRLDNDEKIPGIQNDSMKDSIHAIKANKPKRKLINWFRKIVEQIKIIIERFKNIVKKIILTLKNAKDKMEDIKSFIQDEGNIQAFVLGKGQLYQLIRHVKPKKYKINLKFGTGDPALTGQVLGILGMLMPVYKKNAHIIPDFENIIFEGDIYMKGRITIAKLLLLGFQLYRDKNIKRCYHMIMD